jgi:hypothetical protein
MLQIARHREHFQPTTDGPPISGLKTADGQTVIGWERFILDLHLTNLFCPMVLGDDGGQIANSKVVLCRDCGKWIGYAGTVSHYKDHVRRHEHYNQRCMALANPQGPAAGFVSFIFQTGAPARAIETLRAAWSDQEFPNQQNLVTIMQMVKAKVKQTIRAQCAAAPFVNIAMDGWSDPSRRKYQGITIRTVHDDGSTSVYLAAMKPVFGSEDARTLNRYLESVVKRYDLNEKVLSICTDRGHANTKAFRTDVPLKDFFSRLWMPCCCHLMNNFLNQFLLEISHLTEPVFRLARAFQRETDFRRYLREAGAKLLVIPTYTEIRWCSSHDMFRALVLLWPHMEAFARITDMFAPDLTPDVHETTLALERVLRKFVRAQNRLESDSFATGSAFAGHLTAIQDRIRLFKMQFKVRTTKFESYVRELIAGFQRQWHVLVLQTLLNPSLKFGTPISPIEPKTREVVIRLLVSLVETEIDAARTRAEQEAGDRDQVQARAAAEAQAHETGQETEMDEEPSSEIYLEFRPSEIAPWVPADDQVSTYLGMRETGRYDLDLWSSVTPMMVELRIVALKVLSILTTSASAERAFSVGALLCGDYQMAMSETTVSARLMVQANWSIAAQFVPEVLSLGPRGWAAWETAYRSKKKKWVSRAKMPSAADRSETIALWGREFGLSDSSDEWLAEGEPFRAVHRNPPRARKAADSADEEEESPPRPQAPRPQPPRPQRPVFSEGVRPRFQTVEDILRDVPLPRMSPMRPDVHEEARTASTPRPRKRPGADDGYSAEERRQLWREKAERRDKREMREKRERRERRERGDDSSDEDRLFQSGEWSRHRDEEKPLPEDFSPPHRERRRKLDHESRRNEPRTGPD